MFQVTLSDVSSLNIPIIFPNVLNHDDMAKATHRNMIRNYNWTTVKVVSAGFINSNGTCHGRSETLNIDSKPEDTTIIKTYDYTHGMV